MFRLVSKSAFPSSQFYRPLLTSRFSSTLAFIETAPDGKLTASSLSLLSAAKQLGNPVVALLVGSNALPAASELKGKLRNGVLEKIIVANDPSFDHYLPEVVSPFLTELMKNKDYTHLVVAGSAVGKAILPRVGGMMGNQPVTEVMEIQSPTRFVRPIYAGNVVSTIECTQDKKLLGIRTSSFSATDVEASGISADALEVEECELHETENRVPIEWVSANLLKSERPDLTSARVIVAGGRAFKDKDMFDGMITPLANTLGAAIGATRAAVDNGLCSNSLQIGQTGKIVAPELYIALGISGAVQHVAGMRDSKVIVAVNKDPDAPIFKVADYGLVGDIQDVIPELTKKLKEATK